MPAVRGLEDYLRTLEIVEQRPLNELENCTIGVDVFQWLRSNNFICSESLHSALGGLPLTLEHQVHQQLFKFHEWKIQPLFVFNGLKYSQNARAPFSSSRSRKYAAKRKQAWKAMELNQVTRSQDLFSQISGYVSVSAQDDLIRIFSRWNALIPQRNQQLRAQWLQKQKEAESKGENDIISTAEPHYFRPISWFRAPYYAASQMAYLESEEEMLHAVCGGCDLLMFGGERVILNIDFNHCVFETTELERVLFALEVDRRPYCFIDTCLLSGFDASRTFEPLTLVDLHSLNAESTSTKKRHHRNFSYKYSLEQVLKKGHGMGVIEEFLCTWNDAGSTSSWNSNYSAGTVASMQSARSVRSAGGRSVKSFKSVRSAVNFNTYRQKTNQTQRGASGNIDQMLQCMLGPSDESTSHPVAMGTMASLDEEDEKNENPKYKEYQHLYRIVRDRVCNAKVMSFGGETKIYRPFKWMNDQIEKQKAAQLHSQKTKEEKTKEDDVNGDDNGSGGDPDDYDSKEDDHGIVRFDDNVPSNAYRLLGVGVLSTFLPSAILGGHCIDTTPLIDSNDLAEAMEKTLDLRIKICNILQNAFGTETSISLQRWFQPNRDGQLIFDPEWTTQWVTDYKMALKVLFVDIGRGVDAKASIALVTPLQMLAQKKKKNSKRSKKAKKGGGSDGMCALTASGLPAVRHISQLLTAAYLGTLLTLKHLDGDCKLKGLAMALSKVSKFEFETVMAIDMLQNNDLSAKCYMLVDENQKEFQIDGPNAVPIDPLHPQKNMSPTEMKNDRSMRVLTRCCCLLPMRPFTDGKKPWESQLSHSLAAFNHVSTAYYHGLKYGIESCITWLYCKIQEDATASDVDVDAEETKESEPTPLQRAKRSNSIITSPSFLKELALSLKQLPPEPCTGMGVLIRRFVTEFAKLEWNEKVSKLSDEKKNEVISSQMTILKAAFPAFTRHRFAVQCCIQFFYQICTLVKQLGDAEVLKARTVLQFEEAYEYLRELGIWDAVYFMELTQQSKLKKKKGSSKKSSKKAVEEES